MKKNSAILNEDERVLKNELYRYNFHLLKNGGDPIHIMECFENLIEEAIDDDDCTVPPRMRLEWAIQEYTIDLMTAGLLPDDIRAVILELWKSSLQSEIDILTEYVDALEVFTDTDI